MLSSDSLRISSVRVGELGFEVSEPLRGVVGVVVGVVLGEVVGTVEGEVVGAEVELKPRR